MEYLKKVEDPFSLTFKNIQYSIQINDKKSKSTTCKSIINSVSGTINSGQISAIMGPSGSGKTSLLNFLNNRISFPKNCSHDGEIFINSEKVSFEQISSFSGYVMQDDVLFDILTPKESLKIGCQLRKIVEKDKIDIVVDKLIEDLQLVACKDTLIGSTQKKGISGGERKRTSIGVEMISNPSILFLDEPTSGLDSQTSYKVISLLKKLATEKNVLIICTIHQPSSNIFGLFDNLFLLDKGSLIYSGIPIEIVEYFNKIEKPLPKLSNPADGFMRILEENNQSNTPQFFIEKYKEILQPEIDSGINQALKSDKKLNIGSKTLNQASFWEANFILSKRAFLNVIRNPSILRMRIFSVLLFSFIASSVFWQLDGSKYEGMSGRIGFTFFLSINLFMSQVFGTILSFPVERAVFIREYSSELYSISNYFLSKNIVETPFIIFSSSLFVTIVYFTVGFKYTASNFFLFLLAYNLEAMTAQSLGYMLGSLFSNVSAAMGSVNLLVLPFILFAGTLINEQTMPRWLFWLKYLSPLKYVNEIANTYEFTDNETITYPPGGKLILQSLNYDVGVELCYIILAIMVVAYRILAFIFLRLMVKKSG